MIYYCCSFKGDGEVLMNYGGSILYLLMVFSVFVLFIYRRYLMGS